MIRRPPKTTLDRSSAASDVYKRQIIDSVILQNEPSRKISLTIKADRQVLCNEDSVLLKADVAVSLPVRFGWNTKDSSDEISVYTAGKYQVIATTDEGCSDTAEILIRHSSLSLTAQVTPNLCFSEAKGNIDLVVAGGIIPCLLYTSDAADERSSVDLGGRRLINKKKKEESESESKINKK